MDPAEKKAQRERAKLEKKLKKEKAKQKNQAKQEEKEDEPKKEKQSETKKEPVKQVKTPQSAKKQSIFNPESYKKRFFAVTSYDLNKKYRETLTPQPPKSALETVLETCNKFNLTVTL